MSRIPEFGWSFEQWWHQCLRGPATASGTRVPFRFPPGHLCCVRLVLCVEHSYSCSTQDMEAWRSPEQKKGHALLCRYICLQWSTGSQPPPSRALLKSHGSCLGLLHCPKRFTVRGRNHQEGLDSGIHALPEHPAPPRRVKPQIKPQYFSRGGGRGWIRAGRQQRFLPFLVLFHFILVVFFFSLDTLLSCSWNVLLKCNFRFCYFKLRTPYRVARVACIYCSLPFNTTSFTSYSIYACVLFLTVKGSQN